MNIKTLLLAAVALSMVGCDIDSPCAKAPKKNIAIQMYSMRDDIKKDYNGSVKKLGEMGYTAVEAAGYENSTVRLPLNLKQESKRRA